MPAPDPVLTADAAALHHSALVVDLHNDVLITMRKAWWNIARRHRFHLPYHAGFFHTDLPRLAEGGVNGQFFGLVTCPKPERGCAKRVHREIQRLEQAAADNPDQMRVARTAADLRAARAEGRLAAFLGIEGAHNLEGDLGRVQTFDDAGVRYLGLAHFTSNHFAPAAKGVGSTNTDPLSPAGRDLIAELNRVGMIVDLAHVGRQAFLDAARLAARPVIVSHTGICGVHDHWRNLTDEQIRTVADTDGVIGIIFAHLFVGPPGRRTLAGMVDHLEHVRQLVGARHLALGSDLDGFIVPVRGLEDVSRIPGITAELLRRGWPEDDIRAALGENVLRVLEAH